MKSVLVTVLTAALAVSGATVVAAQTSGELSFGSRRLLNLSAPTTSLVTDIPPINGSNHNLQFPLHNAAGTAERRFVHNDYPDDQGTFPSGQSRPGARAISNAVFADEGSPATLNPKNTNNFLWQFGQFLDHDFGISVEAEAVGQPKEVMDIPVPLDDAFFPGGSTIRISRFAYDPTTGTAPGNPRAHINVQTGWIDASQVYSFTEDPLQPNNASAIRENVGGRLKVSSGDLLPRLPSPLGPGFPSTVFLCGDFHPRCNETPGLTMFHTVFVREHNRKAGLLAAANPSWTDEQIYQGARRWVTSLMQSITVNEFLPALIGRKLPFYLGHNQNVDGRLAEEFVGALYRVGHTLLPRELERGDGQPPMELGQTLFQASGIIQTSADLDAIIRGFKAQPHEKIDCKVASGVRNFLIVDEPSTPTNVFFDLPAINVERGRDLGLPSYNDAREAFGLPRVSAWFIAFDSDARGRLSSVYDSPDEVDLFAGGICERPADLLFPNAQTGALISAVIRQQIANVRDADRFWYQNRLSSAEKTEVENYKLAKLIANNSGLSESELNVNAFIVKQ